MEILKKYLQNNVPMSYFKLFSMNLMQNQKNMF